MGPYCVETDAKSSLNVGMVAELEPVVSKHKTYKTLQALIN